MDNYVKFAVLISVGESEQCRFAYVYTRFFCRKLIRWPADPAARCEKKRSKEYTKYLMLQHCFKYFCIDKEVYLVLYYN